MLASTLALAACSNDHLKTLRLLNTVTLQKMNLYAMKDTVGEQTLQRLVLTKVLEGSIEDAKN